jgi:prolipoprotein diacylglyceryl transferase
MQETSFFVWDVSPIIADFGFFQLRWYSLLFALSFVAAYYIMQWFFKREDKPLEHMDSLAIFMMLGTIIGARLGHVIFYSWVNGEPMSLLGIFEVWKGGLASHGGAIGLLIAMYLFVRKYKYRYLWLADRIAVVAALSSMFIRIGNFFNSEIIGKTTDVSWAIIFPLAGDLLPRHPSQLYEAIFYLLFFIVMFTLVRKNIEVKKHANGFFLGLFMVVVFIFRFFIEYTKEIQVSAESGFDLHIGQWLSIPFIIIGAVLMGKTYNKANAEGDEHENRKSKSIKKTAR